jgi:hypothetical protein
MEKRMRAVLIAVVGLSTLPALAQTPPPAQVQAQVQPQQIQQSQYAPEDASLRHMTKPVIVERELLLERLSSVNEKLSEAIGRSKKDKRLLKVLEDARAELKDVGRQVTSAPAYQPAQPYPPPQKPPAPAAPAAGAAHHRRHAALDGFVHPERALPRGQDDGAGGGHALPVLPGVPRCSSSCRSSTSRRTG